MSTVTTFAADIRDLERDLRSLGEQAPKTMARALNRAGNTGKTAMVRGVAADLKVSQRYVSAGLKLEKANATRPAFALEIKGARIPLIAPVFQAKGPEPSRGKGSGVSYRIGGQRKSVRSFFIARVGSGGHRGVFERRPPSKRKSRGAWGLNLPIVEKFGPSLPYVFEKFISAFREAAEPSLVKNLRNDIAFFRSKSEGA